MPHSRAQIRLTTTAEANSFVASLNGDGSVDKYSIENFDGTSRVNARSLLGVLYAMVEHQDKMFLVNETRDGRFPAFVNDYRF